MATRSVLFAASECAPLAKAGGLGDVVGALPKALRARGIDARIVLPRYQSVKMQGFERHPAPLAVPFGGQQYWCSVWEGKLPGTEVPVYLVEHQGLFGRPYLYDPPNGSAGDNLERYGFFSRAALQLTRHLRWTPDVFHVHDWPTALLPVYLNTVERHSELGRSATVLTIHNMAHQGFFSKRDFGLTHLPGSVLRSDGLEDRGALNLLKGGLYHSTMLTTVSPRYAQEIRTRDGGFGLQGVVDFRGGDLVGILNGIDEEVWNPQTDPHLDAHYGPEDLSGKAECKRSLQRELFLHEREDLPLIGLVSRLNDQKGTDVVAEALPYLLQLGAQFAILGSGDPRTESTLRTLSHHGGGVLRAWIGFNERLAHRIEAGADLFLMPSRFEPCGLNQLYSQRYGTLPIVRSTGGLYDTVHSYDPRTGEGTGFRFEDLDVRSLVETVRWALDTWRHRREHFQGMQVRAMRKRMGWELAAERYAQVYDWALGRRRG